MKPINVLSLFDGISCCHLALDRANIPINTYYASEIEKNAMQVTMAHFPDTIQLGDVEKWRDWNIDWNSIDLVTFGSPCEGFSAAGKGLNFEDSRSRLFFVAVDILNYLREVNPNIKFLMENVKMKKEWEDIITSYLGVGPIFINSRVVSAQDRKRLYWCNWNVAPIKEKEVSFSDICEDNWFAGAMRGRRINSKGSRCDYDKSIPIVQQIECRKDNKINCCTTVSKDNVAVPIKRERQPAKESEWRYLTPKEYERAQTLPDDYTACIKSSHKRRALCGLGWTVDVIAHIFNSYKRELLSPNQPQDIVDDKSSNRNI